MGLKDSVTGLGLLGHTTVLQGTAIVRVPGIVTRLTTPEAGALLLGLHVNTRMKTFGCKLCSKQRAGGCHCRDVNLCIVACLADHARLAGPHNMDVCVGVKNNQAR